MNNDDTPLAGIAEVRDASRLVVSLRKDPLVRASLRAFTSSSFAKIDVPATLQEIRSLPSLCEMPAFNLEGTDGLVASAEWRVRCRNDRVRIVAILSDLRESLNRVKRMIRLLRPHLREKLEGQPAKAADEVIAVALDPIYSSIEDFRDAMTTCEEALAMVDETRSTIDALFYLHKQNVFMTGNSDDPEKSPRFVKQNRNRHG